MNSKLARGPCWQKKSETMRSLLFVLTTSLSIANCYCAGVGLSVTPAHFSRCSQPTAVTYGKNGKPVKVRSKVVSSPLGSSDSSGYRRGSLGIGPNESKVLWVLVGLALVFGVDDDTAAKIGAAQRDLYPASFSKSFNAQNGVSSRAKTIETSQPQ